MTGSNNIPQNVVKLHQVTGAGGGALVQATTKINISQLARQTGLSRQTVRRKLANGWQPPTAPSVEIIEPTQSMATMATRDGHPGQRPGSYWRAAGRIATGLVIAGCGIAIAVTSVRANAWFGRSLTADAGGRRNLLPSLDISRDRRLCHPDRDAVLLAGRRPANRTQGCGADVPCAHRGVLCRFGFRPDPRQRWHRAAW